VPGAASRADQPIASPFSRLLVALLFSFLLVALLLSTVPFHEKALLQKPYPV
jgi:hypothetical protein